MIPDDKLLSFASEAQARAYRAYCKAEGNITAAAEIAGLGRSTVSEHVSRLKRKAARQGYAPEHDMIHTAPPTHLVKGVSTLYGDDGSVKQQWVKTDLQRQQLEEAFLDAARAVAEEWKPRKPTKGPKDTDGESLTVYPLGDPHIGMYAWAQEAGKDFNADIARQQLVDAMGHCVNGVPATEKALIINLGDFFHANDATNMTQKSGNILDVDGRFPRVHELGIYALADLCELALKRHKQVDVINVKGNHDPDISAALSITMKAWFRNEPRVNVIDNSAAHIYYRFGKVLIGTTHGHTVRKGQIQQLAALMATDRPEDWGETIKRYWYTGHIHSSNREELIGALWESFRTLAPNDAWHQEQGYRSEKDMTAIVHHQDYGEVLRVTADVRMFR